MSDYKINKINSDGSVNVTFTSADVTVPQDRATQDLQGITTKEQMDEHANAFFAGLAQEQAAKTAPTTETTDLTAIVGKKQTVTADTGATE